MGVLQMNREVKNISDGFMFAVSKYYTQKILHEFLPRNSAAYLSEQKEIHPDCFRFALARYGYQKPRPLKLVVAHLHSSLCDEFKPIHDGYVQLGKDKLIINQLLELLTLGYANEQELRDAIPDCVAHFTLGTPRKISSPLFLQQSNPHAVYAYEKYLPLLERYAAYHLLQ